MPSIVWCEDEKIRLQNESEKQSHLQSAGDQIHNFDTKKGSKYDERSACIKNSIAAHIAANQKSTAYQPFKKESHDIPVQKMQKFTFRRALFRARVVVRIRLVPARAGAPVEWSQLVMHWCGVRCKVQPQRPHIGMLLRLVDYFEAFVNFCASTASCHSEHKHFFR